MADGPIYLGDPVERGHHLAKSLAGFWLALPEYTGRTWYDLRGFGGRGNHGGLTNGPRWSARSPLGGFGSLESDGIDDAVVVPHSASFDFGTGDFSVGGRFYLRSLGDNGFGRELLSKSLASGTFAGWSLRQLHAAGVNRWSFWPYDSGGNEVVGSVTPVTGAWVHLFGVRRAGTAYLYLNGRQIGSAANAVNVNNTESLSISGDNPGWQGTPLDGYVESASVYGRGLTGDDVAALYDESRLGYPTLLRRVSTRRYFTSGAAGGDISGTCALAFGNSGVVIGAGDLSGQASLLLTPTSALTGAGVLEGGVALTLGDTAALAGAGILEGGGDLVFGNTAIVAGIGALLGGSTLVFGDAAAVAGSGALAGTTPLVFSNSGTTSGVGTLTGVSEIVFANSGTLTDLGSGDTSGQATLTLTPAATLDGAAAVAGLATLAFVGSGLLDGEGDLNGSSNLVLTPTGLLETTGITGNATLAFGLSGTSAGAGTLAGQTALTFSLTAVMQDVGLIPPITDAVLDFTYLRSATLNYEWLRSDTLDY